MKTLTRNHTRHFSDYEASELIKSVPHFSINPLKKLVYSPSSKKFLSNIIRKKARNKISVTGSDCFERFEFDRTKFNGLVKVDTQTEHKIFGQTFNISNSTKNKTIHRSLTNSPSFNILPDISNVKRKNASRSVDQQLSTTLLKSTEKIPLKFSLHKRQISNNF